MPRAGLSPAVGHPPLLPSLWGAGWLHGVPWGAAQHSSISPPCLSPLLHFDLRQGLRGFPGLPGPRGMPGLPVSGAADVPHAKIWVPCSPNPSVRSHHTVPCHGDSQLRSCEHGGELGGSSQHQQHCRCHPGSRRPPWSQRTRADAVQGGAAGECMGVRASHPCFGGCHPKREGADCDVVPRPAASGVLCAQGQRSLHRELADMVNPSPTMFIFVPCMSHPLPGPLVMLLAKISRG